MNDLKARDRFDSTSLGYSTGAVLRTAGSVVRVQLANDDRIVARGRASLSALMRENDVPEETRFDSDLVLGEALSNILQHSRLAKTARFCAVISPVASIGPAAPAREQTSRTGLETRQIAMSLVYESRWFETNRPDPGPLAESGRGIHIIRGFCEMGGGRAEYRFRRLPISMQGAVFRVALSMIKRW